MPNVACGVMMDNTGKILMGRRSNKSSHSGIWEFPGGKQESNETLEECLKREWKEELNLKINIEKCIYTSNQEDVVCTFFLGRIQDLHNLRVNVHEYIGLYLPEEVKKLRLFEGDINVIDSTQKSFITNISFQ
jgi:mutator protein MutT